MTTCTVWYITSKIDNDHLRLSVKIMNSYDWVNNIVIMHTDPIKPKNVGELESEYNKISEFWKSYGYGFDRSCEDGGFDEVTCRNETIQIAKGMGSEWIVQCDSDEFFTPWLGELFLYIDENNQDAFAIEFSCYHFISPSIYIWDARSVRGVMHDGHIRAVRHNHLPEYRFAALHRKKTNPTKDCGVKGTPRGNVFYEPKPCHIHVHDMFGSKTSRIASHKLSKIDEDYKLKENPRDIFPDYYIQKYIDHKKKIIKEIG